MKLLRVLVTGLFISFLGTLPLGTLNLAAMQISISDGIRPALYFALGALLVEIIYVPGSWVGFSLISLIGSFFLIILYSMIMAVIAKMLPITY